MTTYDYHAVTANAQKKRGTLEGDSARHVRQLLRKQGLIPLHIAPAPTRKHRIRDGESAFIFRQLAACLSASVPLEEALFTMAIESEHPAMKRVLLSVRNTVLEGHSFADALRQHPSVFPALCTASI